MKKLIAMLLALTMVLSLAACGAKTETAPATDATKAEAAAETTAAATEAEPTAVETATLNIAYMPNWGALWAVATGIEKGYFAEEGLELNLVQFDAGPAEIAAMEQGSIDIAYIGKGAHKLCPNGTADILLLQHMGDGDSIIGLNGITKLEELKGKKVGYAAGTSSESILLAALESVGLTMDDIEAMNMNASNLTSAAMAGSIDAVAAWAPMSLTILSQVEGAVDICSNVDFPSMVTPGSWVVNPNWVKDHEDLAMRFVRAMYKAMDYASASLTDDAIAEEVAGYISPIIVKDPSAVLEERYTGTWMSSAQLKTMLEDGSLLKAYTDVHNGFVAAGAVAADAPTPDTYVMVDLMLACFGE